MTYQPTLLATLGERYESEIATGLSSFWDNGFTVWIGDDLNSRRVERTFHRGKRRKEPDTFRSWDGLWTAAAEWLHEEAVWLYPTSEYAKRYVW